MEYLPDSQKQAVREYVQIDRPLPYKLDVCIEAFRERDRTARLLVSVHDQDIRRTKLLK